MTRSAVLKGEGGCFKENEGIVVDRSAVRGESVLKSRYGKCGRKRKKDGSGSQAFPSVAVGAASLGGCDFNFKSFSDGLLFLLGVEGDGRDHGVAKTSGLLVFDCRGVFCIRDHSHFFMRGGEAYVWFPHRTGALYDVLH